MSPLIIFGVFFSLTAAPCELPPDMSHVCSVRELNDIRFSSKASGLFVTTGVVQSVRQDPFQSSVILEDATWRTKVMLSDRFVLPEPGDIVSVCCSKILRDDHDKLLSVRKLDVLGQAAVTPPRHMRLSELDARRHDLFTVITEATVVDILPDEVDARYFIWLLKDGATQIQLFVPESVDDDSWIGARIRVAGDYERMIGGARRFPRPSLVASGADSIVRITPPTDPFEAPPLDPSDYLTAQEVKAMDRRTIDGRVLATWNGDSILLRVGDVISHVKLRRGRGLPDINTRIRVSGYPETDLYRIVLTDADWRLLPNIPEADDDARSVILREITRDENMNRQISGRFHGSLIRLEGRLQSFSPVEQETRRFLLETDGEGVPVDFSAAPQLAARLRVGSRIAVTGRCLLTADASAGHPAFPQITGVSLLLRTPADLEILSSPSWWTAERLLGLIAVLGVLLAAILVWNRILNRLVIRRGRQLYRADIARASEALRVEERTRLAVELHDSLSQNLTGVALQINAGRNDLAARTLRSCREELRNCLWDLRNNAIDCASMDEAIRQTLGPHAEDISLNIRFNVPREALSDNTAYAILRIIRELVVNAIRHGGASTVRVAGSLASGHLRFSVCDDGCGFDPARRPGIAEGHFGLQGICERVATLGGEVTFTSRPGEGAKIIVLLPVGKNTPSGNPL